MAFYDFFNPRKRALEIETNESNENPSQLQKQNIIKTCLRSKLSVSTLDNLMRISLDRRAAQDSPLDQAFKKWNGEKTEEF
ncbi:hypothetical protein DPMN_066832 [Dreissena polymorpha]|uniref:Uncharacterized protein n=1 Tax=Dreissena polymorpha TaxID=45954 RepID=A0A9D3YY55_DREPO|nr:hypothetical protein DPMN_066832 [Dreissena polymorpha]